MREEKEKLACHSLREGEAATELSDRYRTILKVRSLIPDNERGRIAGTSHRNMDMASARLNASQ